MDAITRLDKKRSQGRSTTSPSPLFLRHSPTFKDPRFRPWDMTAPLVECVPNISEDVILRKSMPSSTR